MSDDGESFPAEEALPTPPPSSSFQGPERLINYGWKWNLRNRSRCGRDRTLCSRDRKQIIKNG